MHFFSVLGAHIKEFPKECAYDLLELIRKGELTSNPMKALACALPILAYLAEKLAGDDAEDDVTPNPEPTPEPSPDSPLIAMADQDMNVCAEICLEMGVSVPAGGFIGDLLFRQLKKAAIKVIREAISDPKVLIDLIISEIEALDLD